MKKIFLFSLIFMSAKSFAATVCFSDKESYEKVKSSLPASMQQGSLAVVHNEAGSSLSAVAMITPSSKGYAFQMAYRLKSLVEVSDSESGLIKKVCIVDNKRADVTLANGSTKTLDIQAKSFAYKGYRLAVTSKAAAQKLYGTLVGTLANGSGKPGQK